MRGCSCPSTPAAATVILTDKTESSRHPNKLIVVLAGGFCFSIFPFVGQVGIKLELPISCPKHITQLNQYKPPFVLSRAIWIVGCLPNPHLPHLGPQEPIYRSVLWIASTNKGWYFKRRAGGCPHTHCSLHRQLHLESRGMWQVRLETNSLSLRVF